MDSEQQCGECFHDRSEHPRDGRCTAREERARGSGQCECDMYVYDDWLAEAAANRAFSGPELEPEGLS